MKIQLRRNKRAKTATFAIRAEAESEACDLAEIDRLGKELADRGYRVSSSTRQSMTLERIDE